MELVKVTQQGVLNAGFGRVNPGLNAEIYSYESGLFKKHLSLDNHGQNIFIAGLDPTTKKTRIQKRLASGSLDGAFGSSGVIELDKTLFPNVTVTSGGAVASFTESTKVQTRWLFDPFGSLIEKVEAHANIEHGFFSIVDLKYLPSGKTLMLLSALGFSKSRVTVFRDGEVSAGSLNVVRFNPDGSIDDTFAFKRFDEWPAPLAIELWHPRAGPSISDVGHMEVDSEGRVYVGATTVCTSTNPHECSSDYLTEDGSRIDPEKLHERAAIVRLTPDGNIDTSYGTGGYRYGFSSANEWLVTMTLDANEHLTVVANLRGGRPFVRSETKGFVLSELDENGTPVVK